MSGRAQGSDGPHQHGMFKGSRIPKPLDQSSESIVPLPIPIALSMQGNRRERCPALVGFKRVAAERQGLSNPSPVSVPACAQTAGNFQLPLQLGVLALQFHQCGSDDGVFLIRCLQYSLR